MGRKKLQRLKFIFFITDENKLKGIRTSSNHKKLKKKEQKIFEINKNQISSLQEIGISKDNQALLLDHLKLNESLSNFSIQNNSFSFINDFEQEMNASENLDAAAEEIDADLNSPFNNISDFDEQDDYFQLQDVNYF